MSSAVVRAGAGPETSRDRAPGLARDLLCLAVANAVVVACVYMLAALG